MKRLRAPKLVTISIFTTITIIFWVFISLYNVLVSKPKVEVEEELLDPIDPTLDTATLNSLKSKIFFDTDVNSEKGTSEETNTEEEVVVNTLEGGL